MHTSRRFALAALSASLLIALPTAAQAQLGGFLKKKIENRIADKVLGEDSGRRAAPPKFSDDVLEITDARLDQLLRGIAAEEAALGRAQRADAQAKQQGAARQASYEAERRQFDAAVTEYQKAAMAYQKCQMDAFAHGAGGAMANPAAAKMANAMNALPEAERDAFQARIEARQDKMRAAQERGDEATRMKLAAEMDADMQKTLGISSEELRAGNAASSRGVAQMQAEQQKCGAEPVPPREPEDPTSVSIDVRDTVQTAAFAASGLSDMQYTVMRERTAAWLASKEEDKPLDLYGFTKEELEALEAKREALVAHKAGLLAQPHPAGWFF